METTFYILVHIKTPEQLQTIGKFFIGNDRQFANGLFLQLNGNPAIDNQGVLFVELMETLHGLPVNIQLLACTLNELTENYRIITREVFRQSHLDDVRL
jgi:hypothetical protein